MKQKAKEMLTRLFALAKKNGGHIKINTSGGPFMPLVVESVGENVYSMSHYFEQNGDLIPDPDMVFFVDPKDTIHPLEITQSFFGRSVAAKVVGTGVQILRQDKYVELHDFTDIWVQNIEQQQDLDAFEATLEEAN